MRLALAIALAGCADHRTITLLLGPDDHTLTAGFACRADTGELLIDHAHRANAYRFSLVVDTVALGATFPGCRGEEIVAACEADCVRISRFCAPVTISEADIASPTSILARLHEQLGHPQLLDDAPRAPVVIRAATTLQSCDELVPPTGDYPALDPAQAIGCAYSCPVVLEDLAGSLGLALDTLDDSCEHQVRACARFGK